MIGFSLKQIKCPFNSTSRLYDVPYGLQGNGIIFNETISPFPSDFELYLLWIVSEYILITKDTIFLNETINISIFDNGNIGNKHH